MDIKKLEARREKKVSSEETQNFMTLIDNVRSLFNPDVATLRTQVAAGTKMNKRRVSDIGISYRKDYTAGIMSEMVTSGEQWNELYVEDATQEEAVELERQSKIMMTAVNNSNFVSEEYKAVSCSCDDGTVCSFVEKGIGEKLRYETVPFGSFWFECDYYRKPDMVWVEKKTTASALVGKFGEDGVSDKVAKLSETNPDEEVTVIHYCAPRGKRDASKKNKLNKAYELIIYEQETKHELENGGTDTQMFHVYRVSTINNETWGRGPCIDAVCTMAAIEQGEKDLQRETTIKVKPFLAIPASQGLKSFRIIHEQDASLLLYNDTGLSGQAPQQLLSGADIQTGIEYMRWKADGMRGLFFLDYFNPLQDRRNMTLGEARERIQKSHQMVDQITGPLVADLMTPQLKRTYMILGESGAFGDWGEIQKQFAGRLKIRYKSRLANAQRRIRLASILEAMQQSMFVAQGIPEPFLLEYAVQFDYSKLPKELIEGTNAPFSLLRKESGPEGTKALLAQFKQTAEQQAQVENQVKVADAAAKGGSKPDEGSLTQMMMQGQI